jgi:hypothetical protein
VSVDAKDELLFKDAVAYCSFIADEFDTALTPKQMAHLLERFYGLASAVAAVAEELDISMERKLYHVKGRPLPKKLHLMASQRMPRAGLRDAIGRFAAENEAAE